MIARFFSTWRRYAFAALAVCVVAIMLTRWLCPPSTALPQVYWAGGIWKVQAPSDVRWKVAGEGTFPPPNSDAQESYSISLLANPDPSEYWWPFDRCVQAKYECQATTRCYEPAAVPAVLPTADAAVFAAIALPGFETPNVAIDWRALVRTDPYVDVGRIVHTKWIGWQQVTFWPQLLCGIIEAPAIVLAPVSGLLLISYLFIGAGRQYPVGQCADCGYAVAAETVTCPECGSITPNH